jgi:small subunit ribosomal protein S1
VTEEQQDGPASAPEASASSTATPETDAAVAVADEPVTIEASIDADPSEQAGAPADGPVEAVAQAPAEHERPESSSQDKEIASADVPSAEAMAEAPDEALADADGSTGEVANEAAAEPAADEPVATEPPAEEPAAEAPAPARPLGPEPTTMEELLAEQDAEIRSFKHGDVVEGRVVRIDKDEMLVDIGAKSEGVVSNRELFGRNAESAPTLAIGDTVLVYVLQPESPEGHAVLSLRRAGLERKWRSMQELFEAGTIIDAPVIDHNKGGLIVDCGIRGFVPISQIVDFPRRPQNDQPRDAAQEIAEKLQPYVGRKLRLKILEVNRKANRLILSEKVALYEERREKRDELFSSLHVGQKVNGTVRSIAPFGVFVDLGGIDGLVHKSELSWNKVNNPESDYNVGDEVEAEVIDINHERGRISLSIRRLQPDPWHSTVADFSVGDVIEGTVTKLVNFGAFVRVRDGLEGLIHISELSHQRVAHPGDVVHEGQVLKLKIISLDSERHRLGLSLKQAEEPPARPAPEVKERRPRQERSRGFAADTVAQPEEGLDNTLASAFAQVREQMATESDDVTAVAAPAQPVDESSVEAIAADVVIEAAVEAEIADEVAAEAVAEAVAADVVAEEAAVEAAVADVVADEAVAEAVVEAEAVEALVESGPADEAEVSAAEAEAVAAEQVAEEAIVEAAAAEVVAEEAVAEAEVAEIVAEEAIVEAAAAEEVAEETATEAAEVVEEAKATSKKAAKGR